MGAVLADYTPGKNLIYEHAAFHAEYLFHPNGLGTNGPDWDTRNGNRDMSASKKWYPVPID